jgi:SAM-dependent methyltransferase
MARFVDWRVKAITQKAIGALPASHRVNYLFQRYVTRATVNTDDWFHWNLDEAERHLSNWRSASGSDSPPALAIEIGTGWFPVVPLALALAGVGRVITVDQVPLLRPDNLSTAASALREFGGNGSLSRRFPELSGERLAALDELAGQDRILPQDLETLGVRPVIGDARWMELEDESTDLVVSNNVLEHIRESELADVLREMRRVCSPGAVMSHLVDLADHYSTFDRSMSTRNFLRYSERQWRRWDNPIVPQTRLQLSDYRRLIEEAGFRIVGEDLHRAPESALEGFELAPEFRRYPREELLIERAWLVSVPQ